MKSSFGMVAFVLGFGLSMPAMAQGDISLKSDAEAPPAPAPTPAPAAPAATADPAPSASPPGDAAASDEQAGDAAEEEEEEPAVTFAIELAAATSYIWRGTQLSSTKFKPVLQPYAELGFNGVGPGSITVGGWLNQSINEDDNSANREVDLYASYAVPIVDSFELKLGYIVYLVPAYDPVDGQHEFSAVGTFDTGSGFEPYLGVHVDPIRLKGLYSQVGASYTIEAGSAEIAPSLNLGVSKYKDIEFDLQDVTLAVRADVPMGESGLYATATVAAALNGRAVDGEDKLLPYAMLGVGYSN